MIVVVRRGEPRRRVLDALVRGGLSRDQVRCVEPEGVRDAVVQNHPVLVCGSAAVKELQGAGVLPRNRTIDSLRERQFRSSEVPLFVTYDPGVVDNDPGKEPYLEWDCRLAARVSRTGSMLPSTGTYRWVADFEDLIRRVKKRHEDTGERVAVACDLETEGLDPWARSKNIVSIGFSDAAGRADCAYVGPRTHPVQLSSRLLENVRWLLQADFVSMRGANFKFDLHWLWLKWGVECTNFRLDTTLVGSLLNENRRNSLSLHAKTYTDIGGYEAEFDAKYDKGRMDLVPPNDLLEYQGGDCDATYRVAEEERDELLGDGVLARFYVNILHPGARAFERVERCGVWIDKDRYARLQSRLESEIVEQRKRAVSLLTPGLRREYSDKIEDQARRGKSPLVPALVKEYFFGKRGLRLRPKMRTEKTGEPSTTRAHLEMFRDHPDAAAMCDVLKELNGAEKTKSSFVDGFLDDVRDDGLLHPSYMLFHGDYMDREESGTVSGRLACKDPPYQTLPNKTKWAKEIRRCFVAPPGMKILIEDYAQGELRVAAEVAPEPTLARAFLEGQDPHSITGAKLAGYALAEFLRLKDSDSDMFKSVRTRAKAGNFGLLFGMRAAGFVDYAWANYGISLTLEEAQQMIDAFFELYPGLLTYHDRMIRTAHKYKMVRSPLGRIRHLPHIASRDWVVQSRAERQAINSPIQSTLTDMMVYAVSEIEASFDEDDLVVCGMVHDNSVSYVSESRAEELARQQAEIMENLPLERVGWRPTVPFPVDAQLGYNMGDVEELQLTAHPVPAT